MRQHLLFTLYGPLQEWGDVAVGEVRPTSGRPTRSGVLGLLGCALGLRRHEEPRLAALRDGLGLAVRVDAPGVRMIDYHTVQTPSEKAKRVFRARRDELGGLLDPDETPNTILSRREYLADAWFTACLWSRNPEPPWSLEELRKALLRPRFPPYLGRKSCPPGWPFDPKLIQAPDALQAMQAYAPSIEPPGTLRTTPGDVFADPDWRGDGETGPFLEEFTALDHTLHHGRRQFGPRPERRLAVQPTGGDHVHE